jgi:hypothetical protein
MERANVLLAMMMLLLAALLLVVYGDYRMRSHLTQTAPQLAARLDTSSAVPAQPHPIPDVSTSNVNLVQFSALLTKTIDLDEQLASLAARARELKARADEQTAAVAKGNSTKGTDSSGAAAGTKFTLQAEMESRLQEALRKGISLETAYADALRGRSSADAKLADALEKVTELQGTVNRYNDNLLYEPPTRQYKELLGTGVPSSLAPSCVPVVV